MASHEVPKAARWAPDISASKMKPRPWQWSDEQPGARVNRPLGPRRQCVAKVFPDPPWSFPWINTHSISAFISRCVLTRAEPPKRQNEASTEPGLT